ncbi:hypothetical protein B7P43_G02120, partial [Cryptotermes secundus]
MEEDAVDYKPFGSRVKKRKIDSDSEDEYEPPSVKRQKKIKVIVPKPEASKKRKKCQAAPKGRKLETSPEGTTKKARTAKKGRVASNPEQIQSGEAYSEEWSEAEFVAHEQKIQLRIAQNIIHLLDEENTIPFIARYRKELTSDMSPEKLRDVKASYEMAKSVKQKASVVRNTITKLGKMTPLLERSIQYARSMNELE